jgi:phosphate transport system permease protein
MGANRMQTTVRVVLPAALSGIAAAVILGLSRAVGETMIVTLASGSRPNLSGDPREGMQAMTGYIATTAGGENPVGSTSYNTLFAVGLLLFAITLIVNIISVSLVRRFRQEY